MAHNRAKKNESNISAAATLQKSKSVSKTPSNSYKRQLLFIRLVVFIMSVVFGLLHWQHVSRMHENDLFFSHLSSVERELTFRTEMGFYYSYFKQMILASKFTEAWNSLLADTRSEVPLCPPSTDYNGSSVATPTERSCPDLNAMQRFNLYPELLLASAYRVFRSLGLLHSDCYRVTRGLSRDPIALVVNPGVFAEAIHNDSIQLLADQTLAAAEDSVLSCTGLEEPAYFYIGVVFALSGLSLVGLYLASWLLASLGSDPVPSAQWLSAFGALLPVVGYFSNHREATRVQWTPPLRESFAYPFFAIQQAFLLSILSGCSRSHNLSAQRSLTVFQALTYCSLLLGFQLPWQFSQFALCTQVASLLAACCLAIAIDGDRRLGSTARVESQTRLVRCVRLIVLMHLVVLLINYILQFGNSLLLSSVYLPGIVGTLVGLSVLLRRLLDSATQSTDSTDKNTDHPSHCSTGVGFARFLNLIAFPCAATLGTTVLLFALLTAGLGGGQQQQHDGGHILDLLREKLQPGGHFHTFHTRLYTCAAEFDFIGWNSLEQPIRTGLLPTAILLTAIILVSAAVRLFRSLRPANSPVTTAAIQLRGESERANHLLLDFVSLFVVIQFLFFTLMAVLIMRLKLFWTPQMCLTLALLAQPIRWHSLIQSVSGWWVRRTGAASKTDSNRTAPAEPPRTAVAYVVLVLLLAYMSSQGVKNIQAELNIRGQFSALNEEVLIDWFSSLSPPPQGSSTPWVIAGPMSTLGSLRLTLPAAPPYPSPQPVAQEDRAPVGFAFTNHPHYENAELRRRTILANVVYSRKSVMDIWQIYRYQLGANFVIVEPRACQPRGGCSMPELYDLVDPQLANRSSLCEALLSPDVTDYGVTPPAWKPYFDVVYVEPATGRVVLYVRPRTH